MAKKIIYNGLSEGFYEIGNFEQFMLDNYPSAILKRSDGSSSQLGESLKFHIPILGVHGMYFVNGDEEALVWANCPNEDGIGLLLEKIGYERVRTFS
ncbi:hypothetical protein K8R33_04795 [archaeon]|nr:hypothetical protein [archaeon]